eukprot:12880078-Prorocentrum_lima.AAC.1
MGACHLIPSEVSDHTPVLAPPHVGPSDHPTAPVLSRPALPEIFRRGLRTAFPLPPGLRPITRQVQRSLFPRS